MNLNKKNNTSTKITIVSYDNWGYNSFIIKFLKEKGYKVTHINFHEYSFEYSNILYRGINFILKTITNINYKRVYYDRKISEKLKLLDQQDYILVIKADMLDTETIKKINKKGKKTILFINDLISRYPRTKKCIKLFDKVYSFEKEDCRKYNLSFITNFIYNTNSQSENIKYKIFNITSLDKRFNKIKAIANNLNTNNINYKIILATDKNIECDNVEFTSKTLSLDEVNKYISESEIVLDINRNSQLGLSFRIFEAIGLRKKIITTNQDIVNYDFYNPNNIFVIKDVNDFILPDDFLNNPYQDIPEDIFRKYSLENWIDNILNN